MTKTATTGRTIALFAAGLLLASLTVTSAFVPQSSRSLPGGRPSVLRNPAAPSSLEKASIIGRTDRTRPHPKSSLTAIPPSVVSAIGHVLGGNLATPFVIDAVNSWYARIPLPTWCPPNGIFAPVWVVLYAMIGVAASRVAAIKGWKSPLMMLWGAHYLLNLCWAPLFFGMAKLRSACVVNGVLAASMGPIIYLFHRVDMTAAYLLLPYTAWITFATLLNCEICKLNPMDGHGYSNALMEADIAKLQKDAAKKAGL